jgi:non-ribosomal peptide synthetase component F
MILISTRRSSTPGLNGMLHPGDLADSHDGRALTYRELNTRANRLAWRLLALGVRPQEAVGICLQPSPEVVVGLLAILKAGGAYVPLDPVYPDARLAFMVQDTGIRLTLTQRSLASRLPPSVQSIELDVEGAPLEGEEIDNPGIETTAESMAYVLYTSGSTGQSKGVAVPHRAVVRLVIGSDFAFMGRDEVYLHLAPLTFDASTLEIWAPLLNGGE